MSAIQQVSLRIRYCKLTACYKYEGKYVNFEFGEVPANTPKHYFFYFWFCPLILVLGIQFLWGFSSSVS